MAFTGPLTFGSQAGSTLLSARMCTRLLRGRPPTCEKSPPTKKPPAPSDTVARMPSPPRPPENSGIAPSTSPVEAESATHDPVRGPTWPKSPPR